MRPVLSALVVLSFGAALASSPGEPLDCADWVFVEPGLHCDVWVPAENCAESGFAGPCGIGTARANDNESGYFERNQTVLDGCGPHLVYRTELVRWHRGSKEIVGYIDDQCVDPTTGDVDHAVFVGQYFDEERGALRLQQRSHCDGADCYGDQFSVISIEGFATEFEIMQSYVPEADEWGFRVPVMPEGFGRADWFDTFWGHLNGPLDLSAASPVQCEYPVSPAIGDYLTFPDSAPTPVPGKAVYYLTSVRHSGSARVGRAVVGGVLRGRNPSSLPPCDLE